MKKDNASVLKIVCAMLIFGSIGLFRHYSLQSSAYLACLRGAFGAGCLWLLMKIRGQKFDRQGGLKKYWPAALSGAFIGLNWVLLFEAYRYTSVQVATLCYYMQPTIVILLSPVIFREKLTNKGVICAGLSLLGMFLVARIQAGDGMDLKGILLALGAAGLYAGVVIINKKTPALPATEKTTVQMLFACLAVLPYVLVMGDSFVCNPNELYGGEIPQLLLILVMGLVHTGLAYALFFSAIPHLPAQTTAILSYIDPVSALIFSRFFLYEYMYPLQWVGAGLILAAALYWQMPEKIKKESEEI